MAYPFVQAKHYTRTGGRRVDVIVIHTMEAAEGNSTAENVANYFARGTVVASAHYCIDNNSIVQCVREQDVAYHAPGANSNGIGLEHAGYARQSAGEWADAYSDQMLHRSAVLAADLAKRYNIPVAWLSPADLKAGKRGFTSHANVSAAYKKSTHTDPGPNFPVGKYLQYVQSNLGGTPLPTTPQIDMSTPAFMVYLGSPEECYLRSYLRGATKAHPQRPDLLFSQYQIVAFDRSQPAPTPPPYSVGAGTNVPGWGQISGADRFDTKKQLDEYLGL